MRKIGLFGVPAFAALLAAGLLALVGVGPVEAASDDDYSPDGSKVAYSVLLDEGNLEYGSLNIYVRNADGSKPIRLTQRVADNTFGAAEYNRNPDWSPDGSRIVFEADLFFYEDYFPEIYAMNSDGSGRVRLTSFGDDDHGSDPVWSPDGKKIVYRDSYGDGYYMINPDGSGKTSLEPGSVPAWYDESSGRPQPRCTVVGGPGDNRLVGTAGKDVICGLGGADTLAGLGGQDILSGGTGTDILSGGTGNDVLNGGSGTDTVSYADAGFPVRASLATDYATGGGSGSDLLSYGENPAGTQAADRLTGTSFGPNLLRGLGGGDTLNARDGRGGDVADGGVGNDTCRKDATDRVANCP